MQATWKCEKRTHNNGGEFHDQGDAKWIVVRRQLRGHNNTPFGRPTTGRPIGCPGVGRIWSFRLLLISNNIFEHCPPDHGSNLTEGTRTGWAEIPSFREKGNTNYKLIVGLLYVEALRMALPNMMKKPGRRWPPTGLTVGGRAWRDLKITTLD